VIGEGGERKRDGAFTEYLALGQFSGYITGAAASWSPMSSRSQRKATRMHRRRAAARGFVRVEIQAPKRDAGLIRALAEALRANNERADTLRSVLTRALMHCEADTAFDVFGSDLPDEVFAGVFDQPRQRGWREIDL